MSALRRSTPSAIADVARPTAWPWWVTLAGALCVMTLSVQTASAESITIIQPKQNRVYGLSSRQVEVSVKVVPRPPRPWPSGITLEWQSCPSRAGADPCGTDSARWEAEGKRYYTTALARDMDWFLQNGGPGFWRVRAGLAQTDLVSGWRRFRIDNVRAPLTAKINRPQIRRPKRAETVAGDLELAVEAGLTNELCAAGHYELDWDWIPPAGVRRPPRSWTNLGELPTRLRCRPAKNSVATIPRARFGPGQYHVRVRHAWSRGAGSSAGHGVWSDWHPFRVSGAIGNAPRDATGPRPFPAATKPEVDEEQDQPD